MAVPGLKIRKREFVLLLLFSIIVALLIFRTGWIQIVNGAELQRMAIEQQTRDRIINPKRGTIYDRNLKELAISASVDTVSVIPKQIENAEEVARKLSEILDMDYDEVFKKASNKASSIEVVKRRVEMDKTELIRKWILDNDILGIKINEDTKRYYPYNSLASYVIGFTGTDNQGLDGIELTYEKVLKGLPGRIVSETDASGKDMPFKKERFISPKDGTNVVLTIDETIQHIADRHIENAVVDNKCLGGAIAIVMKPGTGEILAMSVKPDFDLNNPFEPNTEDLKAEWTNMTREERSLALQRMWRNPAVADTYEPGSTFKIMTSVAGLEEGIVKSEENFTCTGYTVVEGHRIKCWRLAYGRTHGLQTFKQAVQNSCNPVFVEVGKRLGKEKFFKYINAFGLQSKTGIELPGEAQGIFHDMARIGPVELATISFGQRIKVTPIGLITAVSAVANGGKLMKPQLVKELRDQEGNIIQRLEPQVVRQVISSETSAVMRDIMESVVSEGTGSGAKVSGYRVAGKTGTADQGINTGVYVASFVALAPADNPEVAVLIVLNDPKGESHMGGAIAAPVAGRILADILPYLKIQPRYSPEEMAVSEVRVPEVRGKTLKDAKTILKEAGLEYRVSGQDMGDEAVINQQSPKPDVVISAKSQVILFTNEGGEAERVTVPDLGKKTALEAARILKDLGLNIRILGSGEVIRQEPAAGTEVQMGTEIKVEFAPTEVE